MSTPTYVAVPCHHAKGTSVTVSTAPNLEILQLGLNYNGLSMQASLFMTIDDATAVRDALDRVLTARQAMIDVADQLSLPEAA